MTPAVDPRFGKRHVGYVPVALCLVGVKRQRADAIEDKDYHYTWVKRENEAMETSK